MAKSIKLKDNTYWDSKGVIYKGVDLEKTIDTIKSDYVTLNHLPMAYSFNASSSGSAGVDEFKNYIINSAPVGFSWWYVNVGGSVSCALVQKANSNYLSFLHFSYGITLIQYRYLAGTWYSTSF